VAKILLIDDDADLVEFLRADFAEHGHEIVCLERAEQAPETLRAARPPFRLVLLDNNLPGMSGIEFLEALQSRDIKVPVILVTGYATSDMAIRATKLGAHDYVIKPDDFQSLSAKLRPIIADAVALTAPLRQVPLPPEAPPQPAAGPSLVGKSEPMACVYKLIGQFAPTDHAVLLLGETGTGKELAARALHTHSTRKDKPFVALNCAAFPENLLETELFGHEKGAFTGAEKLRKGKFEYADGGTIFLDEIGDMPLRLQAKLLRVLENQELERVGSDEAVKVNVRFVSATHQDLEAAIRDGQFRRDLFYRLNRVTIRLPPLRERMDDLPRLCAYFLGRAAEEMGRSAPSLADATLELLRHHRWPGNVRELENIIKRALGVCRGPQILPPHLLGFVPEAADAEFAGRGTIAGDEAAAGLRQTIQWAWDDNQADLWPLLRDLLEKELLQFALAKLGGNQSEVAQRLHMARGTVIARMRRYGLK
jgi:DNA-binding NtrC family response regulator